MLQYKRAAEKEFLRMSRVSRFPDFPAISLSSRLKGLVSKEKLQVLLSAFFALTFVQVYSVSPVTITAIVLILSVSVPLLLKKPEYGIFLLAVLLPFRDIHLVSFIHLKRFVIWSLFFYAISRKILGRHRAENHSFSAFTGSMVIFVLLLILSLTRTASEVYTIAGFTEDTS